MKVVKTEKFQLPEYIVPFPKDRFNEVNLSWEVRIWKDHCMKDVKDDRVVFLIRDSKGNIIDAIGRALGKRLPKWKRYGNSRLPFVAWGNGNSCVLVEDCYSACTVANHNITGVALLGTSLLEEHKRFLSINFDEVVVALDPDALSKTLQIRRELQSWVNKVKVLRITADLKYEKDIDINNLKEMIWN